MTPTPLDTDATERERLAVLWHLIVAGLAKPEYFDSPRMAVRDLMALAAAGKEGGHPHDCGPHPWDAEGTVRPGCDPGDVSTPRPGECPNALTLDRTEDGEAGMFLVRKGEMGA